MGHTLYLLEVQNLLKEKSPNITKYGNVTLTLIQYELHSLYSTY
jgi:hypothetical protein